jgi:hypothetical protein
MGIILTAGAQLNMPEPLDLSYVVSSLDLHPVKAAVCTNQIIQRMGCAVAGGRITRRIPDGISQISFIFHSISVTSLLGKRNAHIPPPPL